MNELGRNIIDLLYLDQDNLLPIPNWAKFFIELGTQINDLDLAKERLIIALSLPTRMFCSPLISFGYITNKEKKGHLEGYLAHANFLKSLPKGSPVIIHSQTDKIFKGLLIGYDTKYFEIQTDKNNNTRRFIEIKDSLNIQFLPGELTLPLTQKGREPTKASKFCEAILGKIHSQSLVSKSYLESVIIGPKSTIKKEVLNQTFSFNRKQMGNLQDILRIKEFQAATEPYRTKVISDRIKPTKAHSEINDLPIILFDGAQAFLKWHYYWRDSNWIVIFDKTEYQFDAAVDQINRIYTLSHTNEKNLGFTNLNLPLGIEFMAFGVDNNG